MWKRAVVVRHTQHHEDYNVKGDNPPWTRVAQCEDGSEVSFDWGTIYRDRTHEHNTRVGATVWIDERGGVTAHEPNDVTKYP